MAVSFQQARDGVTSTASALEDAEATTIIASSVLCLSCSRLVSAATALSSIANVQSADCAYSVAERDPLVIYRPLKHPQHNCRWGRKSDCPDKLVLSTKRYLYLYSMAILYLCRVVFHHFYKIDALRASYICADCREKSAKKLPSRNPSALNGWRCKVGLTMGRLYVVQMKRQGEIKNQKDAEGKVALWIGSSTSYL